MKRWDFVRAPAVAAFLLFLGVPLLSIALMLSWLFSICPAAKLWWRGVCYRFVALFLEAFCRLFAPFTFRFPQDALAQIREVFRNNKRILITCNHQLFSDWIYVWLLYTQLQPNSGALFSIVLKRSLESLPVVGSFLRFLGFLFLNREYSLDQPLIANSLSAWKDEQRLTIVIFPEGRTISDETKKCSEKYAESLNYPLGPFVLVPRYKGAFAILKNAGIDGVLDLTLSYASKGQASAKPVYERYSLRGLAVGTYPTAVQVKPTFYPSETIPLESELEFSAWLRDVFYRKNSFLSGGMHPNFQAHTISSPLLNFLLFISICTVVAAMALLQ